MPSNRFVLFALVFGTLAVRPAGAQPPNGDAGRIVARWDQRQRSAPAVKYVVRWELLPSDIKPGTPKPGEAPAPTGSGIVLLDPTQKRLRVDKDDFLHATNRRERLSRSRMTIRYDGQEQACALLIDSDAAAAPAEAVFRKPAIGNWGSSMRWPNEFNPLLWGHGLIWTSRDTASGAFPFDWRATPGRFVLAGRKEIKGRACVELHDTAAQGGPAEVLWVDNERGGLTRWRRTLLDGGAREINVTYQETPHGWLPQVWEAVELHPGRAPVTTRFRIASVTFDPPFTADDFRIALRPGMVVNRHGEEFHVRDNGSLEAAPVGPPATNSTTERVSAAVRGLGWLGLAAVAVVVVLAGVLVHFRHRQQPADSE